MISGRRSPYGRRRGGLLSGIIGAAMNDHSQKNNEDEANRRYLALQQEHERSLERERSHQSDTRGRSSAHEKGQDAYEQEEPQLPSYEEATRPRALSATSVPLATSASSSFQSSDRDRGQHQRSSQHLMPPDASMAGLSLTRPRSAQEYYGPGQSMAYGSSDPQSPQSYLRDPRAMDSFLSDPYSRGPSLFGPREPAHLSPRHERRMMHMENRYARHDVRRGYGGGGRNMGYGYEDPFYGRRRW